MGSLSTEAKERFWGKEEKIEEVIANTNADKKALTNNAGTFLF